MRNKDFRELQLSSTQLVIIFVGILIIGVVIFLLGVSVGKKQSQIVNESTTVAKGEIEQAADKPPVTVQKPKTEKTKETKPVKIKPKESISKEKTRVKKELENIDVTVYASETNFLMITSDIPLLSKKLRARGIIVMDLSNQMPKQFLRVTIGKVQENNVFLKNLKEIIQLHS